MFICTVLLKIGVERNPPKYPSTSLLGMLHPIGHRSPHELACHSSLAIPGLYGISPRNDLARLKLDVCRKLRHSRLRLRWQLRRARQPEVRKRRRNWRQGLLSQHEALVVQSPHLLEQRLAPVRTLVVGARIGEALEPDLQVDVGAENRLSVGADAAVGIGRDGSRAFELGSQDGDADLVSRLEDAGFSLGCDEGVDAELGLEGSLTVGVLLDGSYLPAERFVSYVGVRQTIL